MYVPDRPDIVLEMFANGEFERPMPEIFVAVAGLFPGVLLDIGANTGLYSLLACSHVAEMSVIAFEPFEPVLELLQRNVEENGFGSRIDVRDIALSDRAGSGVLHIPTQAHGLTHTSCSLNVDFCPSESGVQVRISRIDDEISVAPTLIKIDIEGHEAPALLGGIQTIKSARPIIFIEVLDRADFRALNGLVRDLDFRSYRLRETGVIIEDDIVFDPLAWNHVFVPVEKDATFRSAVDASGLSTI
jgi:FkbM family methyltransferase